MAESRIRRRRLVSHLLLRHPLQRARLRLQAVMGDPSVLVRRLGSAQVGLAGVSGKVPSLRRDRRQTAESKHHMTLKPGSMGIRMSLVSRVYSVLAKADIPLLSDAMRAP